MARPEVTVVTLVGDGGFMFTMPELCTAVDVGMALPVIVWENCGLKQIQDDMAARQIARVGVEGRNPDFVALAKACGAGAARPQTAEEFKAAFAAALESPRPTVIVVEEGSTWLTGM